ncbi:transcription repressor OFP8-like [Dendrobium catenatum]|uniref:Transcription repressor n=1 Tax=Dendrobium catenatum TaxID=906689 RepID=A0A2I0VF64_9ASPA|nr:transcription repressor OFP8-like [Dendrobium catenatum]PKU62050.1 hypothetical protein MA16_Dca012159 [Dendrobium catenatum]
MDNKPRLKDRLARIFRPSALLRSSGAAVGSSRSLSAGESTRSFSAAADIAHEPIFISRCRASEADELHFALLRRSFSLDRRPSRNLCGGCRPTAAASPAVKDKVKKENRKSERSDLYATGELGEGDGKTCPPASPSVESPNSAHLYYYWIKEAELKDKRKKTKKKMIMKQRQRCRSNRHELSISSSFGEEGFGFFSSEETDTFFSSRSFSSDSSEFYRRPSPKTRKSSKKKEKSNTKKQDEKSNLSSRRRRPAEVARRRDAFINDFQPLVSVSFSDENEAEKKRREGFPVLKKSSDPYSDFRSSMVEMIVERQIFGAQELERLLHSYLSLNSPEIHSAIFRAFADISKVLFSY